ncbi:MAG: caspase family protein [Armatimonadia bacterium]
MYNRLKHAAMVASFALICSLIAGAAISATPKGTCGPLQVTPARWTKPAGTKALTVTPKQVGTKGTLFSDGFESSFPGSWSLWNNDAANDPNWGRSSYQHSAGSYSLYCAQTGPGNGASSHTYPANIDANWVTYGPFSTSSVTDGRATFKIRVKTESGYDEVKAGWSLNDVDYEGLTWSGDSGGWITADVPLKCSGFTGAYTGKSQVYFSFWFYSDATINYEGVYVDQFTLSTGSLPAINSLIKTSSGSLVQGAALTLSNSSLYAYTGTDGKASVRPPAGTYTVTPKKPGVIFTPTSRTVTLGSSSVNANFTAASATGDGVVRYYGVCVGIEQYQNINNLTYCVDDAVDMRDSLIACGWSSSNIALLKDSQATKAAIKSAIEAKMALADADDVFLYFHSSHGDQNTDMAPLDESDGYDEYLCTYDTTSSTSTEIRDDELGIWLSKLRTKKYVVLIDTCFSGGMVKSRSTFDFGPDINRGGSEGGVGTRDLDDNASGVVITASDVDEYSQEDSALQNGVFAYYVIEGINRGTADSNKDSWFSAEELYAYAAPLAHAYNPDQTVTKYDGYSGSLNFAKLQTLMKTTVPARNATGISRTTNITVTFRYPVNQASAQSHFAMKSPSGTTIAGTFTWPTANRVMIFNPSVTLASNTQYTVWARVGLQPLSGPAYWYSDNFKFTTATSTAALAMQAAAVPTKGDLTQITVNLTSAANVSAAITNLAGRTIAVLPPQDLEAGLNTLLWDGKSRTGSKVPAGQYFVRLQATDGDGNCASCIAALTK